MNQKPSAPRQRASTACTSCRKRRTRCIRESSNSSCLQCERHGLECINDGFDKRKRNNSTAYIKALEDQINDLRRRLSSFDPERTHQSGTRQLTTTTTTPFGVVLPLELQEPPSESSSDRLEEAEDASLRQPSGSPSMVHLLSQSYDMVDRIIGSPCDSTSMTITGPAISQAVLHQQESRPSQLDPPWVSAANRGVNQIRNQDRWAVALIDALPSGFEERALECFWSTYNSIFRVVEKDIFLGAKETRNTQYYSTFLHLAILAVGALYADHSQLDSQTSRYLSALQRECKLIAELELEGEATIALVQGLLLLAELEMAKGTEDFGFLLIGTACRLCLETRPDENFSQFGENNTVYGGRRAAFEACLIYDTYISQLLQRPPTIKLRDVLGLLDETEINSYKAGMLDDNSQIHSDMVSLTEFAHETLEKDGPELNSFADPGVYLDMTMIDHKLADWEHQLPASSKWDPKAPPEGPHGLFFLHIYYHNIIISFHLRIALNRNQSPFLDLDDATYEVHRSVENTCRKICFTHAIEVSRVLKQWLKVFPGIKIPIAALQIAWNAVKAILSSIGKPEICQNKLEARSYVRYLREVIVNADMGFEVPETLLSKLGDVELAPDTREQSSQQRNSGLFEERSPTHGHMASSPQTSPANEPNAGAFDISRLQRYKHVSSNQPSRDWNAATKTVTTAQHSSESRGTTIFNKGDPGYDPIFLPKERELLGLSPTSSTSSHHVNYSANT